MWSRARWLQVRKNSHRWKRPPNSPISYQNLDRQQNHRANKTRYEKITAARANSPRGRLHWAGGSGWTWGTALLLKTLQYTPALHQHFWFWNKAPVPRQNNVWGAGWWRTTSTVIPKPCMEQSDALDQYFDRDSRFTPLIITTSNFARASNISITFRALICL